MFTCRISSTIGLGNGRGGFIPGVFEQLSNAWQ